MRCPTFALSAVATMALTAAAAADDAQVLFDNAIDPDAAQDILSASQPETAAEALFIGWLTSRQLHQAAVESGADAAQIDALSRAVDAAGAAYEAALIAQNTVVLATAEPVLLDDESFADLIVPAAE